VLITDNVIICVSQDDDVAFRFLPPPPLGPVAKDVVQLSASNFHRLDRAGFAWRSTAYSLPVSRRT